MFGAASDCKVWGSVGMKFRSSPKPGRASDVVRAAVHRHGHEQVERHLAVVERDEATRRAVDLAGVELGDQIDVLLREETTERLRRGGLRERPVEWSDVGDVDVVADAPLVEEPVGQEGELQRRNRALDRHVDDVDDQPTTVEESPTASCRAAAPSGE